MTWTDEKLDKSILWVEDTHLVEEAMFLEELLTPARYSLIASLFYDDSSNFLSSILALKGFIKNALRLIEEIIKSKVRAALRELARQTEAIKALHKPLFIVPHSLHPDEAAV
jgi:hypothetical protein